MDVADLVPAGSVNILRAPLLHFIVLGTALFALKQYTADGRTLGLARDPIVVSAESVERMKAEWIAETGRNPDRLELEASIRHHADEEILFREALRVGLDRSDPVVHDRLVQNLRFVHGDAKADAAAMFAEALALDMNRSDVVVRRRLVEAMDTRLAADARVSRAEVRAYVTAHPERFGAQPRVSFDQVFLSADRHGAELSSAANAMQPRLASASRGEAAKLGDPFLFGTHFTAQSADEIARAFGAAMAESVAQAPVGKWVGPLRSPYGLHFVRVEAKVQAPTTDTAAVERAAYYTLLDEREREVAREKLVALRRGYPLTIEWPKLASREP